MTPTVRYAITDAAAFLRRLGGEEAASLALRLELNLAALEEADPGPDPYALDLGPDPEDEEAAHAA